MSKLNKSQRQAKKLKSAQSKLDNDKRLTGGEWRALNRQMDKETAETQARQKIHADKQLAEYTALMEANKAYGQQKEERNKELANMSIEELKKDKSGDVEVTKVNQRPKDQSAEELIKGQKFIAMGDKETDRKDFPSYDYLGDGMYWRKDDPNNPLKNRVEKRGDFDPSELASKTNTNMPELRTLPTDTRQNNDMKNMVNKTNLKDSDTALNASTPTQDTSTDTNTSASSGGIDASEYDDYTKRKDWSGTGKSDPNAEIEQHFDDPSLSPYQKQKGKEAYQDVYADNPIGQYSVSAGGMANYTPAGEKTSSPKPVTTPKTQVSQEELDKEDRDKLFANLDINKKTFGM